MPKRIEERPGLTVPFFNGRPDDCLPACTRPHPCPRRIPGRILSAHRAPCRRVECGRPRPGAGPCRRRTRLPGQRSKPLAPGPLDHTHREVARRSPTSATGWTSLLSANDRSRATPCCRSRPGAGRPSPTPSGPSSRLTRRAGRHNTHALGKRQSPRRRGPQSPLPCRRRAASTVTGRSAGALPSSCNCGGSPAFPAWVFTEVLARPVGVTSAQPQLHRPRRRASSRWAAEAVESGAVGPVAHAEVADGGLVAERGGDRAPPVVPLGLVGQRPLETLSLTGKPFCRFRLAFRIDDEGKARGESPPGGASDWSHTPPSAYRDVAPAGQAQGDVFGVPPIVIVPR